MIERKSVSGHYACRSPFLSQNLYHDSGPRHPRWHSSISRITSAGVERRIRVLISKYDFDSYLLDMAHGAYVVYLRWDD